jgi:phage terminase large subunit-like protein
MPEPRDAWSIWCLNAGRGSGKSRTGSETIKIWVDEWDPSKGILRIALVGATSSDVNSVMIGGDSGILSVYPEHELPRWVGTNRKIYWYNKDGSIRAIADCFSSEEPQRLRGPQFHKAWIDEVATFRYEETMSNLMFGLRLGDNPQAIVTTTPKPVKILLDILALPTTWTTVGSSYENRSNLAPKFFNDIITKFEGTATGRQELLAEIIEEIPNAIWNYDNLDKHRIDFKNIDELPEFLTIVLAIDPATTSNARSAETGMCVAAYGEDDRFYILHLDSYKMSPDQWAAKAIQLFDQYRCDKMIAEVNNGGDLVETVIRAVDATKKVYSVHASHGKTARADPIATMYERGRVSHVGRFPKGEDQLVTFNPIENKSGLCDCTDSLVWAMTWLVDTTQSRNRFAPAVGGARKTLSSYKKLFDY